MVKKMLKKGSFDISVSFIVIIIIALVMLAVLTSVIRNNLGKASIKLEEQIVVGAPAPHVEIKNGNGVYRLGESITFEPFVYTLTDKTKIVDYYWDLDGDGVVETKMKSPTKAYYEPGDYIITLKVLNNLGGVGEASVTIKIITNNQKNMSKYSDDMMFFIPKRTLSDGSISNWREILQVIPLMRWFDKDGDHQYGYVAIEKISNGQVSAPDITAKMNEKGKAILVDMPSVKIEEIGIGKTGEHQDSSDIAAYMSYWADYDSVVLTDANQEAGALIAALFAAYYNAPLIFLDNSDDYGKYDPYITGKRVYIIDSIPDKAYNHYITGDAETGGKVSDLTVYKSSDLRDPTRRINRILELNAKVSSG